MLRKIAGLAAFVIAVATAPVALAVLVILGMKLTWPGSPIPARVENNRF